MDNGLAFSNDGPLQGTAAALPLNDPVGVDFDRPFVLTINKSAAVVSELAKLFDVVLYEHYAKPA